MEYEFSANKCPFPQIVIFTLANHLLFLSMRDQILLITLRTH